MPRVADLRRRVYDLPDDVETVSASVTDPGWWERVDADRPMLALAEGLFMYLTPSDVHAVLDRLLARCASGEVAFDAVAGWTLPVSNAAFGLLGVDTRFAWGFDGAESDGPPPAAARARRRHRLRARDPGHGRAAALALPGVRRRPRPARGDAPAPLRVLLTLLRDRVRRRSSSVSISRNASRLAPSSGTATPTAIVTTTTAA